VHSSRQALAAKAPARQSPTTAILRTILGQLIVLKAMTACPGCNRMFKLRSHPFIRLSNLINALKSLKNHT
jgi:hypothetical protein